MRRLLLALALAVSACHATLPPAARPQPVFEAAAPALPGIRAWWIGHATVLVRMADRWILTDPNFSSSVGLLVHRRVAPGIDLDALPEIDWVLISHAHMDHLDHPSLAQLNESARLAVPPGVADYLRVPFREVDKLLPWQAVERDGMRITAVPTLHGNGRFGLDELYHRDAHTGFVVEYAGLTLFFAGDTGYDPEGFKRIGERFPHVDLALIPVGPSGKRFWRVLTRTVHVNPAEALQIFDDVHARYMIPIHFGTFFNSSASEMEEITTAIAHHPRRDRVLLLRAGESAEIPPRL